MTTPGFNNPSYLVGQFGAPLFGVSGVMPFTGNYFWVDETNGSDGNTGGPTDGFATLTQALSRCSTGNSDVIFMTGSVHTAATIAWSLNKTHLIGLSPPSQNSRARIAISNTASTTAVTPLVNVTGAGCIFQNIECFNGVNAAATQVAWADVGGVNYYKNCNFIGTGHLTAAAQNGNRSLTVGAGGECLFEDCTIGGDTVLRATGTNSSLEFISGSARNVFRRCIFQAYSNVAGNTHVLIASGGMDRYALFDGCTFHNFVEGGISVAMSAAISNAGGTPGGNVITKNCLSVGATALATTGNVFVDGGALGATTTGIGILAT
jgi:hypothetical protein